MRTLIISLTFLAACGSGGATLPQQQGGSGEDTGGDGGDDGGDDGGVGEDGGDEGEAEPTLEDWEGDWVGLVRIWSEEDAYGWDDCEGELKIDVDDDGEVEGRGECLGEEDGGWGDPDTYELGFLGEMNDEGELEGVISIDAGGWGTVEAEVAAQADDDELQGELEGETTIDGWGESYTLSLEGELELERD